MKTLPWVTPARKQPPPKRLPSTTEDGRTLPQTVTHAEASNAHDRELRAVAKSNADKLGLAGLPDWNEAERWRIAEWSMQSQRKLSERLEAERIAAHGAPDPESNRAFLELQAVEVPTQMSAYSLRDHLDKGYADIKCRCRWIVWGESTVTGGVVSVAATKGAKYCPHCAREIVLDHVGALAAVTEGHTALCVAFIDVSDPTRNQFDTVRKRIKRRGFNYRSWEIQNGWRVLITDDLEQVTKDDLAHAEVVQRSGVIFAAVGSLIDHIAHAYELRVEALAKGEKYRRVKVSASDGWTIKPGDGELRDDISDEIEGAADASVVMNPDANTDVEDEDPGTDIDELDEIRWLGRINREKHAELDLGGHKIAIVRDGALHRWQDEETGDVLTPADPRVSEILEANEAVTFGEISNEITANYRNLLDPFGDGAGVDPALVAV